MSTPEQTKPPFWSIERVVTLLTPLFTIVAGIVSKAAGATVGIPEKDYVALFITGATAALTIAVKWLDGRRKFVADLDNAKRMAENLARRADFNDVITALEAHTAALEKNFGLLKPAPVLADDTTHGPIAGTS